ncbi:endonuclease/exonuclease/phosphatase family protein [Brevibacterium daeguense]|uniref:Endonuclease/exonuclease/phosphatase family protein n=1 Tax=Brevibacterium daeguense TaxID=909936 RepID=A0ABP8EF30_9MICO|nr:endonuclease/exonuclease/phosphatase family protein [Brevibacterium daeguense]
MSDALIGPIRPPGLHLMSFNIRRPVPHFNQRHPDLWANRRQLVRRLLASERPTVLGVQEALPEQIEWVLASLGSGYRSLGRDHSPTGSLSGTGSPTRTRTRTRTGTGSGFDGAGGILAGEATPIIFDSRRLELVGWRQPALSATPHVAGSRTWGNLFPRAAVVAHFVDRSTGNRLCVINTHLDPLSRRSQLESARMLLRLVKEQDDPAVVMGDANADIGSAPYRELTAGEVLRDSWAVAEHRLTEAWGTFSNYRAPRAGRRIDWIMVTAGITVHAAGINAVRFGGAAASDHEPVQTAVTVGA